MTTLLLTLAIALGAAGSAQAGTVGVTITVKGSGMVTVTEGLPDGGVNGTCNKTSNTDERVEQSCPRWVNEEPFEAWSWLRATPNPQPAGHWRFSHWEGCSGGTRVNQGFTECAVHSGCCSLNERYPKAVFADDLAPTIVSGPNESFSPTVDRLVAFSFASNEVGTTECRFDADTQWRPCVSGESRVFSEGSHSIQVRGVDNSGQAGSAASRSFTVVDTAINSGPDGLTNDNNATFTYSTGIVGSTYYCQLNSAPYTECAGGSKTYPNLADGAYTFRVYAQLGGWYDRVAASRTFTVDATAPETSLSPHGETPSEGAIVTATSATFAFTASEGATFQCKLDSGAFDPCTSPRRVENLAPGQHAFEVRATDAAGNTDSTPVRRTWTISPPDNDADGYVDGPDCDDSNPNVNPGKPEILDNDVDENCDGVKGRDTDRDDDGSHEGADCDDNDARRTPGKAEILDNDVDEDCNGVAEVNLDRDGDGSRVPADCDDANAAIRPGAVDVPGNGLDEDCANGPAPLTISVAVTHAYKAFAKYTRFTRFGVKGVPEGATVVATCKTGRKACKGKARKTVTVTGKSGTVMFKSFTKQRLKPRTTITITVKRPNSIGQVTVVAIRKKRAPKITTRAA